MISISIYNWIPIYRLSPVYLFQYSLSLFSTSLIFYFLTMRPFLRSVQIILKIFFPHQWNYNDI